MHDPTLCFSNFRFYINCVCIIFIVVELCEFDIAMNCIKYMFIHSNYICFELIEKKKKSENTRVLQTHDIGHTGYRPGRTEPRDRKSEPWASGLKPRTHLMPSITSLSHADRPAAQSWSWVFVPTTCRSFSPPEELARTAAHLKSEFEMKDIGKTRYCLGLEIEHRSDGNLVHQTNYIQKVLRRFNEDKAKPSSTLMVVRSLDAKRDPFRPNEDDEEILEPEVLYLSAISALLYLAQCTRPDISFVVNLLARYNNAPTSRHWTGVKDIFRYLKGTADLGLFFPYGSSSDVAPPYLESILTLLVIPMHDTYLIRTRRVLKRVMSFLLEAPQSLGGQLNRP